MGRYRLAARRIRQELSAVERSVARAKRAMALAQHAPQEQDLYLDSAALNLHDFYTGLERAFEHVAATVDEHVPAGRNWHRELLCYMAEERASARPAVISADTRDELEEYLRFRHVVRNVYAFEFDVYRLARLVDGLGCVLDRTRHELGAFADFLERLEEDETEKTG
jgi:hypothetical protein